MNYLIEFICKESGSNTYYECGYKEYKKILVEFSSDEVKDRTNCEVSWQEHSSQCHEYNLTASI